MAWEERKGRSYYYRKQRAGDQVISQYIGTGDIARLLAQSDTHDRRQAEAQRRQWRRMIERERRIDTAMDEAAAMLKMLTDATLVAVGYRTHKGQWRKHRGEAT